MTVAKIITIAAPKGGVGKTTTTVNLGAALAKLGYRILLIDFDHTAHLTRALGFNRADIKGKDSWAAIHQWLTRYEPNLQAVIRPTQIPNIDAVPTTDELDQADAEMAKDMLGPAVVLKNLLAPVADGYDFIFIDTISALVLSVTNALVASDYVLIPVEAEDLSMYAINRLLERANQIKQSKLNPGLAVLGGLINQTKNWNLHKNGAEAIRADWGAIIPIFDTTIKQMAAIAEAGSFHQSVFQYLPRGGEPCDVYNRLAEEFLKRIGGSTSNGV